MALESTVRLKERLRAMARRERNIIALAGVAKVLIALGLFSGIFFLLDWLFYFSTPARAFLLFGGLGAAGWIVKTELRDPLRRRRPFHAGWRRQRRPFRRGRNQKTL